LQAGGDRPTKPASLQPLLEDTVADLAVICSEFAADHPHSLQRLPEAVDRIDASNATLGPQLRGPPVPPVLSGRESGAGFSDRHRAPASNAESPNAYPGTLQPRDLSANSQPAPLLNAPRRRATTDVLSLGCIYGNFAVAERRRCTRQYAAGPVCASRPSRYIPHRMMPLWQCDGSRFPISAPRGRCLASHVIRKLAQTEALLVVKVLETNHVMRVSTMQIAEAGHDPKEGIRALFTFERYCPYSDLRARID
jgi:hypothetical protein